MEYSFEIRTLLLKNLMDGGGEELLVGGLRRMKVHSDALKQRLVYRWRWQDEIRVNWLRTGKTRGFSSRLRRC